MSSSHPYHFNLVAAAHASMIEHGFQPDFPANRTELAAIEAHPDAARRTRHAGPAQSALVFDRQRHVKGSGPD